jgi:homocitrate synthase
LTRYVHFASRLTGWNAVKTRVGQLGFNLTDEQCKEVTSKIKALADVRPIAIDDADSIIRSFHFNIHGGKVDVAPTEEGIAHGVVNADAVQTNGHTTPLEVNGAAA